MVVVVALREMLLLALDDNLDVSRSSLSRCLRRHGVPNLKALRERQ